VRFSSFDFSNLFQASFSFSLEESQLVSSYYKHLNIISFILFECVYLG